MTIRVASGNAERWSGLTELELAPREYGEGERFRVEQCRGYRDRLIVKLQGVDGAAEAASKRGWRVIVPDEAVPTLPPGEYWVSRLIGAQAMEESGEALGVVEDIEETGGPSLLRLRTPEGKEILVPFAEAFVVEVSESGRAIRLRLPDDLRHLGETTS